MNTPSAVLMDIVQHATKGDWRIVSDENSDKFNIEVKGSEPPKIVLGGVQDINHYDLRLFAIAKELALEVLEFRQKQLELFSAKPNVRHINKGW